MDHNEATQAVEGFDQAEILEIIDHHRIGSLETSGPVYFRNQPVGCTATIITQMYDENGVDIPPQIAGLLLAAILSDTLAFRSPTCTPVDENAAKRLAKIAGVDIEEFSTEMFEAGEKLDGKTPEEVFLQDFKVFMCGDIRFGVAQGSYMTRKNLLAAEALLQPYLEEARNKQNVEDIYRTCDYITIHVPLMDSTKGMINKAAIDEMKDGVVLLNYARDLLVDEDAVLEALKAGKMKKYVTDFANPKVVGAEGTIVTPHLGASTKESEDNCAVMAVKEIRDFLENGNVKNSVNFPNCDMGVCTGAGRVTICHKNIPGMLGAFTTVMGNAGVNISDMTNKGKGDYAYTMMDLESEATEEIVKALEAVDGVLRVRIIK